jgi:septal ring factor EnvC (AmiA/AmiB activator)
MALLATPIAVQAQGAAPERKGKLADIEKARKESEKRAAELAREAERLEREAADTAKKLVGAAAEARTHEQAIAELRDHLADIAAERKTRSDGLAGRRARLAELLAALERIARHPPEALMAYARTPQDTLRAAMLLRDTVPKLEAEARKLREELEALAGLEEQAAARSEALTRERAKLEQKRKSLAALVEKKRSLARNTKAEEDRAQARARALAREAKDLRELLAGIERERRRVAVRPPRPPARDNGRVAALPRPAAPAIVPGQAISRARGRLARPVVGRLAVAFGAREEAGAAKGVRFETAPGAQVIAPFGGEVVFSGPFRGYGPLLIIDHGEGYHTLLAGLGRIDAAVGQKILAGEPVGIMSGGSGPIRLYMELRRGGKPVDPVPWLATPPNSKVSG